MQRRSLLAAALLPLLTPRHGARAAAWPVQPLRLIVPFAPGGSSEIIARTVATELQGLLAQEIRVEHKPGGSGNIAMQECLNAGDGHTLVLGHIGTLAVNPFLFARLPFDVNRDFHAVSLLAKVPSLYVVHPGLAARDLRDFIALARERPGKLSYGSAGSGSAGHLGMEYLKAEAGLRLLHVPYRGTGPQMTDLLAGRLDCACVGAAAVMPFIRAGRLRCIATGSRERLLQLPEVYTVAEQGLRDFEMTQWYGLLAPATMPPGALARLAAACARAVQAPVARERFDEEAVQAQGSTPAQFGAFIRSEQARWERVVARASIRLE